MTIGRVPGTGETLSIDREVAGERTASSPGAHAELLPAPFAVTAYDDLMTSLAVMMMRQKHEQRVTSDQQREVASKAQEEAHARKIANMRELADDTFMQGVLEGALEGAGAVATAASALTRFDGETKEAAAKALDAKSSNELSMADFIHKAEWAKESKRLARDANLMDAASKGFAAGSRLGGASARSDQEHDREEIARAEADIDRAKSSVEAAGTEGRRAAEDIRETIGAIRQYLNAKTQLANAAIIRG